MKRVLLCVLFIFLAYSSQAKENIKPNDATYSNLLCKGCLDADLNFIIQSIDNSIPPEFIAFKEKYGVGFIKENCVVDPLSFKKATDNNQKVAIYLSNKHGNAWRKDLPVKPLGV